MQISKRRISNLLLLFCLAFAFAGPSSGQANLHSAPVTTLVKVGRLLDPRTGNVLAPAAVLIQGHADVIALG